MTDFEKVRRGDWCALEDGRRGVVVEKSVTFLGARTLDIEVHGAGVVRGVPVSAVHLELTALEDEKLEAGETAAATDRWSSGYGVTHFDNGTPRQRCADCGAMDGWHYSPCRHLEGDR